MYYPDEVEQGDMLDKRIEKLMRIKEGNKNMRGEDVYNYVVGKVFIASEMSDDVRDQNDMEEVFEKVMKCIRMYRYRVDMLKLTEIIADCIEEVRC